MRAAPPDVPSVGARVEVARALEGEAGGAQEQGARRLLVRGPKLLGGVGVLVLAVGGVQSALPQEDQEAQRG